MKATRCISVVALCIAVAVCVHLSGCNFSSNQRDRDAFAAAGKDDGDSQGVFEAGPGREGFIDRDRSFAKAWVNTEPLPSMLERIFDISEKIRKRNNLTLRANYLQAKESLLINVNFAEGKSRSAALSSDYDTAENNRTNAGKDEIGAKTFLKNDRIDAPRLATAVETRSTRNLPDNYDEISRHRDSKSLVPTKGPSL